MPNCSVVMVSYHTGDALLASIRITLAQEKLKELIIVDNGNPPEMLNALQALASAEQKLVVLTGHGNVGFSKGCNLGAAQATGDYLLLLNPDAILPPGALRHVMSALKANPQAMLASCQLLNPDGTPQRGSRRNLLTPASAMAESLILPRFLGMSRLNLHEQASPDEILEVPAISGAFMMFPREAYVRLGGMDEGYFLHVEDLDICQRVHKAGGSILFVPSVHVVHLLSTSEVSGVFIEQCKADGFRRYFTTHFGQENPVLVKLVMLAIALRQWLKIATMGLRRWRAGRQNPAAEKHRRMLEILLRGFAEGAPAPALEGKTVLVTGASTPLGMAVIGRLLAAGAGVMAVSRHPNIHFEHQQLSVIAADLEKPTAVFSSLCYDLAVHCAPIWLLPSVLPQMEQAGCRRVVAFGSTSIEGKVGTQDAYEQQVIAKLTDAETAIASSPLEWVVLRPTLIYGAGLDRNISRLARCIRRFDFIGLYPPATGLRQPVHALDLAQAATAALATDRCNKAYNVSGGQTLSYREMVEEIFARMGKKPRLLMVSQLPLALNVAGRMLRKSRINGEMAKRQNRDLVFSHEDAATDLGYQPRAFLTSKADLPL